MRSRYAGSKDGNHDEICAVFPRFGFTVHSLPETRIPGFPDTVISGMGLTALAEIKNLATKYGRAGLTPEQTAFHRDWRGGPLVVIYTVDQAIAFAQQWRREAR